MNFFKVFLRKKKKIFFHLTLKPTINDEHSYDFLYIL